MGPIRVVVVGTGFFGAGLVRRMEAIQVCADRESVQAALDRENRPATSSLTLAPNLDEVDLVTEAAGDLWSAPSWLWRPSRREGTLSPPASRRLGLLERGPAVDYARVRSAGSSSSLARKTPSFDGSSGI